MAKKNNYLIQIKDNSLFMHYFMAQDKKQVCETDHRII